MLLYVALITAGFGAALGLLSLTGQISLGKDAPAWVQAIGSIVAILIAVAVPSAQHYLTERKQEREMADKARSLGLMLLPSSKGIHQIPEPSHGPPLCAGADSAMTFIHRNERV
ncbi:MULTISPECIES: hypothetical protein [Stenotrophomonas]|uniref:hypothetical protein n=1 Tax=Stenotrophomonas TaxID=40323 RepID=UPI002E75AE03|nr:hypothetical protein [Stenotrophomonas sp. SMYL89]